MGLRITGGRALLPGAGVTETDVAIQDGRITTGTPAGKTLDATGLLVLPGIVDLHGDAFERQIQPRPGVAFPMDLAVADTAAQLLANGITTAFHGVTLSWEPGLRSAETWTALLDALGAAKSRTAADMRVHLRWEAFNLDALDLALDAIRTGRVHLLAFNDHTPSILAKIGNPTTGAKYSERAGMSLDDFRTLAARVAARKDEVPAGLSKLAQAAQAAGLPMASHDDDKLAVRDHFRALGARICEFPMAKDVAQAALAAGDWVAMGSPNVVRGGSHLGWASAAEMAEAGICRVLTSDYYYPALLQAPFVLAARGVLDFAAAWALVSTNPAEAGRLTDRGTLADGKQADLIVVSKDPAPRIIATISAGRISHMTAEGYDRLN
jgi:alpha-D-ribose 1-methylphosphonate 5-triphosphate diphosphatase